LNQEKSAIPEVLTAHFLPRFVRYYAHVGDTVDRVLEDLTWEVTLRMINGFDHVVFPTVTQQSLFQQEGLAAPSIVISNGIDTDRYQPDGIGPELEQRYRLPDRPRLLFVGRLAPDKKINILIEALAKLDHASLLLVGRGDYRKRLEDLVGELGVMERVHFLGFVPEQDLPDVYRASDLFTIASDVEVQSIPTLQAASCGLPIVAANAAALPEIVEDGVNGYLVPPNDPNVFAAKVRELLKSPEKATRFGHASHTIGRRHANVQTFAEYERLYLDVAGSGRAQLDPN
jgi:glycosyltransferase involved in cell wall biosynthesis